MFSRELCNKCFKHECIFKPLGCTIFNYLLSVTGYICAYANTLVYSLLCFCQFRIKLLHEYSHGSLQFPQNCDKTPRQKKGWLLAKGNKDTSAVRSHTGQTLRINKGDRKRSDQQILHVWKNLSLVVSNMYG